MSGKTRESGKAWEYAQVESIKNERVKTMKIETSGKNIRYLRTDTFETGVIQTLERHGNAVTYRVSVLPSQGGIVTVRETRRFFGETSDAIRFMETARETWETQEAEYYSARIEANDARDQRIADMYASRARL
jgi:glycine cleavage system regulatory protein